MLSGGALEGDATPTPSDWSFVGGDARCEIEVGPEEPRSVNVGCYAYEKHLYVHSHRWADTPRIFGESWVAVVRREPDVRLGMAGRIYELRARPVADEAVRREILAARGFDPPPDGIHLFQLEARKRP